VPLGVVGAVQELGSVLGPLYGAAVLVVGDWRDIFWINLTVGLVLAAGVAALRPRPALEQRAPASDQSRPDQPRPPALPARLDWLGLALLALFVAALLLVMRQPTFLVTSVSWGRPFVPFGSASSPWLSPLGLVAAGLGLVLALWLVLGRAPFFAARDWWSSVREADLLGALLLSATLGGVILAFATADPQMAVLSPVGPWALAIASLAAVLFVVHQRRAANPLVPHGSFAERAAWGSLAVSFFVGAALIAALIDIPIFARTTVYPDSQLMAALVLVELLVALPIGALAGGFLTRFTASGLIAGAGMACAALGFWAMSRWDVDQLHHHVSSGAVLALTGFGFGLALAPVNAALLAATRPAVHGVTSALLVVSRMVGMLVGISALTTIGLRRYYAASADFPSPSEVCGGGRTRCDAYSDLLQHAGVAQLHAIFLGAALCAVAAGVLAVVLFRGAQTRATPAVAMLTAGG
jgi:hypothetical protein